MYKQTLSGLALCCLALFASCSDKDLQAENEKLEKDLAAERSKTVTELKKDGNDLVVSYSNGTSQRVAFTQALQGNLGVQAGQDGVGIQSITFNELTGIMTITLTNGEVSEFKISGSSEAWTAVLVGDTNGRLFLQEIMLGSVPVVKAEYNANYQLTYLESNQVSDLQTRKAFDVTKKYENGVLSSYELKEYAIRNKTNYTSEYFSTNAKTVIFNQNKGDRFKVSNGDGTFKGYLFRGNFSETEFAYYTWDNCVSLLAGQQGYDDYRVTRKVSENTFKHFSQVSNFNNSNSQQETWFALEEIVTIHGILKAGELENTEVVKLETDAQGRITRMYESVNGSEEANSYIAYSYNAAGLMMDSKTFSKDEGGNWVADGTVLTYTYNSNNKLISTTETDAEGNTKEVQKAVYDANGNPTEIWAYSSTDYDWRYDMNPVTGRYEYHEVLVREAGLYKIATIEYDHKLKNFFGNTITALVPELDGYKTVNAIKRVTVDGSYSYGNIEYQEFDEHGYPSRITMTGAYFEDDDFEGSANLELLLKYKIKPKQ